MVSAILGILLAVSQDPGTIGAAAVRPVAYAHPAATVEQAERPIPLPLAFRQPDRAAARRTVPPPIAGSAVGTSAALPMRAPAEGEPQAEAPQLFEYSDAYYTRLTIHRIASYATVPLFITEFLAGQELLNEGESAAGWAKSVHGPVAGVLAGLFVVNTVTGGWNLLEARRDPANRKWRTAHSILMLLADAGFVATGSTAGEAAFDDDDGGGGDRSRARTHRAVAITSMGVSLAGYLMMLPPFRRD